jgi:hypothetical protein
MKPAPTEQLDEIEHAIRILGDRIGQHEPTDLGRLIRLAEVVDVAAVRAVYWMRQNGRTWEEIGALVGISKQGAIRRWGQRVAGS